MYIPVVKNQHLLLCTLLICNAAAIETLPIFLDSLVTAWGAILISVTLILLFGEIIPQSLCSRYGLAIGATVAPFVRVLVSICFPIAFPISKVGAVLYTCCTLGFVLNVIWPFLNIFLLVAILIRKDATPLLIYAYLRERVDLCFLRQSCIRSYAHPKSFTFLNGLAKDADVQLVSNREKVADALTDTLSTLDKFEQGIMGCIEA